MNVYSPQIRISSNSHPQGIWTGIHPFTLVFPGKHPWWRGTSLQWSQRWFQVEVNPPFLLWWFEWGLCGVISLAWAHDYVSPYENLPWLTGKRWLIDNLHDFYWIFPNAPVEHEHFELPWFAYFRSMGLCWPKPLGTSPHVIPRIVHSLWLREASS